MCYGSMYYDADAEEERKKAQRAKTDNPVKEPAEEPKAAEQPVLLTA